MVRTMPVLAGALVALAIPALAQRPQAPTFGSEVSLVLLPVFAYDGAGRAARGLRAEDFEVTDEGKPVEIVSFELVDTTEATPVDDLRLASAARRRFLFLFDKSFTEIAGLQRAQRAAQEVVRTRLRESDLAAVATFDINRGVRVVANFTEDRALLYHAIETLGVASLSQIRDPLGLALDLQATDLVRSGAREGTEQQTPQALLDSVTALIARQMKAADRMQYRGHIETLAGALGDLARGLRQVEGRKQVLYFSAGFDSQLLVGDQGAEREATSQAVTSGALWEVDGLARYGDSQLREDLSRATRELEAADAVVHTIDVTGLAARTELGSLRPSGDRLRENPGRESLNLIAADTGGRLFKDNNDLGAALESVLDMTSRYYVLGIQPAAAKGPGAFHRLKVRVARKGLRLSHRPGYHEKVPARQQTALQRQFEAAQLLMTGAGDADLRFASLCVPFPDRGERQTVGLVVQVPRGSLRWQPGTPEALELYGYAVDERGRVVDHLARLARVDPGQADPQNQRSGVAFYAALRVPPGRYTLRMMVHERESGRSGFQFLELAVPEWDAQSGFLLPPLVMDDPGRWVTLELGRADDAYPFVVDGQPFMPRALPEVRSGTPERIALLAFEPRLAGDPAADLEIWSSLVDAEGQRTSPGAIRIERVRRDTQGRRTYVLGYTPAAAAPGDYTLRIGVGEASSILESFARLRFAQP